MISRHFTKPTICIRFDSSSDSVVSVGGRMRAETIHNSMFIQEKSQQKIIKKIEEAFPKIQAYIEHGRDTKIVMSNTARKLCNATDKEIWQIISQVEYEFTEKENYEELIESEIFQKPLTCNEKTCNCDLPTWREFSLYGEEWKNYRVKKTA